MPKVQVPLMLLYAIVADYCIETGHAALGVGFALLTAIWPFIPWPAEMHDE